MTPFHSAPDCEFFVGDVLDVLAGLPERSVHIAITSPPYWGLRDYGIAPSVWGGESGCVHEWNDEQVTANDGAGNWTQAANGEQLATGKIQTRFRGDLTAARENKAVNILTRSTCLRCSAWRGCLGLEPRHDCLGWARGVNCGACYLCHMRTVAAAVWRVLRDDGCFFINIGDSYAANRSYQVTDNKHHDVGNGSSMSVPNGLKPKDRVGIPERLALALQADGWTWRDTIHLCKVAPMPESVRDRTTQAHEPLFLFTKKARYFYDADAVREPHSEPWRGHGEHESATPHNGRFDDPDKQQAAFTVAKREYNPLGRNPRSWMLWKSEASALAHRDSRGNFGEGMLRQLWQSLGPRDGA